MRDKVHRWKWMEDDCGDFYMERWGSGDWVKHADYAKLESLHASIIDLIDKTQSCTSGFSFGECLDEIKRKLGPAKESTDTEER